MIAFMGLNEKQLTEAVISWEQQNRMPTKSIMTRLEAINKLMSIFGNVLQAEGMIDFYITAGMLEIKEEENKPIFEIKENGKPLHIKIWDNGRVEGIDAIVINRIPELVAKLKQK